MRERELIQWIRKLAGPIRQKAVLCGIGDDAAVLGLPRHQQLLATTDLCIEYVHFRREWHPAESIGHRCLVRGLSDIAAMGGTPLACFLSLGLPAKVPQKWLAGFFKGFLHLSQQYKVQLAGGDISSAQQIIADIIVLGTIPAGKAILRSGASPGDHIYVTGKLGASAAILGRLFTEKRPHATKSNPHFYPQPRLEIGKWLQQHKAATSMIDLSDGLSVDLAHICEESRVSARIEAGKIPVAKNSSLELALHGGEDYELLFTASSGMKLPPRIAGIPITQIGTVRKRTNYSPAIQILRQNGSVDTLEQHGWEHFGGRIR
jgi:thiamine-monophosphate kinase